MASTISQRRAFLKTALTLPLIAATSQRLFAQSQPAISSAEWMEEALLTRALKGPLSLRRFVEPVYVLLEPTSWYPSDNSSTLPSVTVPKGFVTDLASIPQVFFSSLRPDGNYAHAAVVHDYLYWRQDTSRQVADSIIKQAMVDLEVSPTVVSVIYSAVRTFGKSAWRNNTKSKAAGERRVLNVLPEDPLARWEEWRVKTDVFSGE